MEVKRFKSWENFLLWKLYYASEGIDLKETLESSDFSEEATGIELLQFYHDLRDDLKWVKGAEISSVRANLTGRTRIGEELNIKYEKEDDVPDQEHPEFLQAIKKGVKEQKEKKKEEAIPGPPDLDYDGLFEREILRTLKHALSTHKEDKRLTRRDYTNQGLIGYIYHPSDKKHRIPLSQSFDEDTQSYSSYFGNDPELKIHTLIGYVSSQGGIPLNGYSKNEGEVYDDRFQCTNPIDSELEKYGYKRDPYKEEYFLAEQTDGTLPLYVYSNNADIKLFEPLLDPNVNLDYKASFWSDSATENDEFGRESLVRGVVNSVSELFETYKDAYTILLNGEWGTGKSSMLKFFDKQLSDKGWHIINYNAWENQSFKDPWWILINAISKRASKENLKGNFSSHSFWKFRLQYRNKVVALALMLLFGVSAYYFSTTQGTTGDLPISYYASLVGLVGSVITVITGIANSFFFKSVSNEELKEQFTDHPFKPIRDRFNQIAENNKLAIFIDDLDRCEVNATVTLLEGIQNLFKGKQVLYIVAADGQWVSNCFNEKYGAFQKLTNDGCSIGDKFLQKSFQLTMNVPKPNPEDLKKFWDRLVGAEEGSDSEESNDTGNKTDEKPTRDEDVKSTSKRDKNVEDESKDVKENIEHYLEKFLDMGVPDNPRQMKRFINQYVVMRQTMVVEGTIEEYREDDNAVKFLIFSMRFPTLANQLKCGEVSIKEILNKEKKGAEDQKGSLELTQSDRDDIKKLLTDIDESLIQGDFYSF